jgi:hypothetical protein
MGVGEVGVGDGGPPAVVVDAEGVAAGVDGLDDAGTAAAEQAEDG